MSAEIDGYEIGADDPLGDEQRVVSQLLAEARPIEYCYPDKLVPLPTMAEILAVSNESLAATIEALVARHLHHDRRYAEYHRRWREWHDAHDFRETRPPTELLRPHNDRQAERAWQWNVGETPRTILQCALQLCFDKRAEWNVNALACMFRWMCETQYVTRDSVSAATARLASLSTNENPCSAWQAAQSLLARFNDPGKRSTATYSFGKDFIVAIERLRNIVEPRPEFPLDRNDTWAAVALDELTVLSEAARSAWSALLNHCRTATSANPTTKWLKTAADLLQAVDHDEFCRRLVRWIPRLEEGRNPYALGSSSTYRHTDVARGLAWCSRFCDDDAVRQALTDAVLIVNRSGAPGSVFATAAVYALGAMPNRSGLGALAVLKARVRRRTTLAQIDKAFRAAAERAGMTPEEIEEACVPTYGLTEVGRTSRSIGEFTAELTVEGLKTSLSWLGAAGKRQASVPAVVKTEHAEELKDLKAVVKDIEKLLPAVRDRLDGLFRVERTWPVDVWRERYHDHPLVGATARKLIWEFIDGPMVRSGLFHGTGWIDADGRPLEPAATATVRLWHPINCSTDEVVAWRERLQAVEIRQPFKQAHREVYRLTDAEQRTETYSNRFAAHVLRQHQFAALCASRRWYYQLRVAADVDYKPPSLTLPAWNLKAEYWIEPLGEFGDGTNDAGTFVYVATDQVRFYVVDGRGDQPLAPQLRTLPRLLPNTPLPLDMIPQRAFSEVMRDVDLFVGVASVGNDPNWSDGGPEGRYRDYWQAYSFGELAASAETRREVLRGLIPKLKIADRCRFEDRFLVVRGDLRTYKIHFGSANILMEPNDEYLCIVPDQRARFLDKVFLPFDGDERLSVILSKALLLADDKRISDPSIVRQIVRT